MPKEDFDMILDLEGTKLVDYRDKRYDAVVHLVTAAIGAEKFYTTANNAARSETVEQARALDYRTLNAWMGHPNLTVVDNSTGFEAKMNRVVNQICKSIGALPRLPEKKFLVESFSFPDDLSTEVFNVEIIIIEREDQEIRAIRRTQDGNSTYMLTTSTLDADEFNVISRQISGREYMNYAYGNDYPRVTKKITYFLWDGHYYALNEYTSPVNDIVTLEVERNEHGNDKEVIPPFITVSKDVTTDSNYSSKYISKRKQ